jgi:hypothetical protein
VPARQNTAKLGVERFFAASSYDMLADAGRFLFTCRRSRLARRMGSPVWLALLAPSLLPFLERDLGP